MLFLAQHGKKSKARTQETEQSKKAKQPWYPLPYVSLCSSRFCTCFHCRDVVLIACHNDGRNNEKANDLHPKKCRDNPFGQFGVSDHRYKSGQVDDDERTYRYKQTMASSSRHLEIRLRKQIRMRLLLYLQQRRPRLNISLFPSGPQLENMPNLRLSGLLPGGRSLPRNSKIAGASAISLSASA